MAKATFDPEQLDRQLEAARELLNRMNADFDCLTKQIHSSESAFDELPSDTPELQSLLLQAMERAKRCGAAAAEAARPSSQAPTRVSRRRGALMA